MKINRKTNKIEKTKAYLIASSLIHLQFSILIFLRKPPQRLERFSTTEPLISV